MRTFTHRSVFDKSRQCGRKAIFLWVCLVTMCSSAIGLCKPPGNRLLLNAQAEIPELGLVDANSEIKSISVINASEPGYWVGVSYFSPIGGHLLWYSCSQRRFEWIADVGNISSLRRIPKYGDWQEMIRVDGRRVGTGVEELTSHWFPTHGRNKTPLVSIRTYERSSSEYEIETIRKVNFYRNMPRISVTTKTRKDGAYIKVERKVISIKQ